MPSSSPTSTCPREDVLVAYQLGALGEAEREATRAHLAACGTCRAAAGAAAESTVAPEPGLTGPSLEAGQRVGRFVLMERLGAGAMGTVYAAYDSELDRRVALKFLKLPPGASWDAARRDAMTREARALARVAHPNVLSVFDAGLHDGQPFLATEFVDGGHLRQALAARSRSSEEVLRILVDAGRGLHAAHLAGLVHRDFKPENVMLGKDGRARVADFGLAGELGPGATPIEPPAAGFEPGALATLLEQRGRVGTPAYMAPEVARGERATALADQFSFCVTAVEALTGRRPFPDALTAERETAIARGLPELEGLPRRVRGALGRGLSAQPQARFGSMEELLERLRPPRARSRARWLLAPVVLLAAGVAVLPWLGSRREAAQCAQAAQVASVVQGPALLGAVERKLAAELGEAEPGPVRELRTTVDGFVSRWAAVRSAACFGATPQARATEAARVACLGRKLDQVTAVLTVLKDTGRPIAGSAVKALGGVSSLEDCTLDAAALPSVEPPVDPALTRALDTLSATFELGDYAGAQRLGQALEPLARAQPSRRFLAECLVPIARSRNGMGDNEAARTLMLEAFEASDATGLKANAALALLYVGAITGLDLHRPDEGLALIRVSEVNARRDRLGDEFFARLAEIRGRVLDAAGHFEEGALALQDALARTRALPGAPAFALAKVMSELASAQHEAGRRAASLELFAESIARLSELAGSRHPLVAVAQTNQANVLASLGRDREAFESYRKALATQRERLGDKACNTLDTRASLSLVQARLGEPRAALEEARAVVDEEENARCPGAYFESALWHLAEVARVAGNNELSAATAQRLLERITADPSLRAFEFDPELQLARVESARGHHPQALKLAQRQCEAIASHAPRGHPARTECELARVRLRTAAGDAALATDPLVDALAGDDRELAPDDVALRAQLRARRPNVP